MTHTPGPWHIGMKPGPMIYGPNGEQVLDIRETLLENDEHRANARLIAAAPDLLAVLKDLTAWVDGLPIKHPQQGLFRAAAHAAIAKAEGKS